ncbi:hypothetical protein FOXYSP1_19330 [Fusarium oxysporum f. sp. phaseoli]
MSFMLGCEALKGQHCLPAMVIIANAKEPICQTWEVLFFGRFKYIARVERVCYWCLLYCLSLSCYHIRFVKK